MCSKMVRLVHRFSGQANEGIAYIQSYRPLFGSNLKTVYTIGNCQKSVFSLGETQHYV